MIYTNGKYPSIPDNIDITIFFADGTDIPNTKAGLWVWDNLDTGYGQLHDASIIGYEVTEPGFIISGGTPPDLPNETWVVVMLRNGKICSGNIVEDWFWNHSGEEDDIVGYWVKE